MTMSSLNVSLNNFSIPVHPTAVCVCWAALTPPCRCVTVGVSVLVKPTGQPLTGLAKHCHWHMFHEQGWKKSCYIGSSDQTKLTWRPPAPTGRKAYKDDSQNAPVEVVCLCWCWFLFHAGWFWKDVTNASYSRDGMAFIPLLLVKRGSPCFRLEAWPIPTTKNKPFCWTATDNSSETISDLDPSTIKVQV